MAKAKPIVGLDVNDPILECASLIIETRLGEMLNYEPFIEDVDRVYELHQMRIAAKRLRYSMEIFQPLYAEYTGISKQFESATDEVKALQEHLGEIHDADVLVPRLEEHLSRLLKPGHGHDDKGDLRTGVNLVDLDACQGVLSLCSQLRKERASRYQLLLKDWARLRKEEFFDGLVSMVRKAAETAVTAPAEAAV